MTWNARLDSALGVFHWEPDKNLAAPIMANAESLAVMNAAFDLISLLLPERESYEKMYDDTLNMLNNLQTESPMNEYLKWETKLLRELGYALDLGHCSGCGCTTNLNYISPKTGRAVCDDCAAPYISHIYKLPLNLNTTLKFLEKICVEMGVNIPYTRKMISAKFS